MATTMIGSTPKVGSAPVTRKQRLSPFLPEHTRSLNELGQLLEGDLARLSRTIADESERLGRASKDPLFRPAPNDMTTLNKKRRASRSLLVHLFRGEIDEHFISTMRGTWLPMLLGRQAEGNQAACRDLLDYIHGVVGGCLHSEPAENLVPRARIQIAMGEAFDRMRRTL